MNIKIIVATHKEACMPNEDIYLPLQVGAKGKESLGFQRDDEGINISEKNRYYCELTGVYWAWKNLSCDVVGLVHYRRFFGKKNKNDFYDGLLNKSKVEELIGKYDVILPKMRCYYIENLKTHFNNHLRVFTSIDYVSFLETTILKIYPEYMDDYRKCFNRNRGHMCNMFVMKREEFDNYCTWLFDILEDMEANHSIFTKEPQMLRIYGFIGELLLDIYIMHNKLTYCEYEVIEFDTQSFFSKFYNFCKRKFLKKR